MFASVDDAYCFIDVGLTLFIVDEFIFILSLISKGAIVHYYIKRYNF